MATESMTQQRSNLIGLAKNYWHILIKWKWTIASVFFITVGGALVYSFTATPIYISSGSIWIEDDPNILPFEDVQSFVPATSLSSHTRLLTSRSLAASTIEKLRLSENAEFVGKPKKGAKPPDPADPIFREVLVAKILSGLTVSPVERTRLVDVSFSSHNPKLAADILNGLFDGYIDMIIHKRYSASERASQFLNEQIAELRKQIEERERELNRYGSEKDILPMTATDVPVVSRISEVNTALTAATLDRINKLNYYNQLKDAPLGEIPNVQPGSLIQRLKEQYLTLSRQYAMRLSAVKPEYPEMQKLKSELDSATEDLRAETQNLVRSARYDYEAALRHEQSLQRLLSAEKGQAYKASSNSVLYNSLKIELDNKKALLEALSLRQGETDVSARLKGLEAVNVWVVDKAEFPLSPTFPKKTTNILIGLIAGLVGGLGLALGLEYLNHTVKTSKDVENSTGLPTLGHIPAFEAETKPRGFRGEIARIQSIFGGTEIRLGSRASGQRGRNPLGLADAKAPRSGKTARERQNSGIELIAAHDSRSIQAENYRSIRTSLLVSSPPGRIKSILFTSPLPKEGKSSTISNLGIVLAESMKRVVIIDSDLRRPKQAEIFGPDHQSGPGLSSYLSSNLDHPEIVRPTSIPNLHLITSGPLPPNPIELLTSEKMDSLLAYLKRTFDFILLDAPPLLAVSDALAIGPMSDAIILVIRGGQTPLPAIRQAKQKLDAHKLKCLGVILNGVDMVEQDGYYARQYYHYARPG